MIIVISTIFENVDKIIYMYIFMIDNTSIHGYQPKSVIVSQ